jgi:hypothetical protein
VGDVSLALIGVGVKQFSFCRELLGFGQFSRNSPDIEVNVEWVDKIERSRAAPLFDSGAIWTLFREGSNLRVDFCSPVYGERPYKQLLVNRAFDHARLMLSNQALASLPSVSPLEYPTDELLFTNYLAAHALGVEVHGCGLIDSDAGGHLLLGHSGAGKSTTARLWQSLRNPEILSDDRLILRIERGELWMYGTPWHGEGQFASSNKAKLDRILILQHGNRNQMIEMSRARAAAELFARSFPPFHSPEGLQNVMDFLNRVVNLVPCFEFHFVPDASAVNAVLEMKHAAAA